MKSEYLTGVIFICIQINQQVRARFNRIAERQRLLLHVVTYILNIPHPGRGINVLGQGITDLLLGLGHHDEHAAVHLGGFAFLGVFFECCACGRRGDGQTFVSETLCLISLLVDRAR